MCPIIIPRGPNFNLYLLLYTTNGFLLILAIYIAVMGHSYSKIPGPTINGAQAVVITCIIICINTILKLITLFLQVNQLLLNIINLIGLVSIFSAQLIYAVSVFTTDDTVKIRSYLKNAYNVRTVNDTDRHISLFQGYFLCCGINGMDDPNVNIEHQVYVSTGRNKSTLYNATNLLKECCPNVRFTIICTKLDSYKDGCLKNIHEVHKQSTTMIGIYFVLSSLAITPVAVIGFKALSMEN